MRPTYIDIIYENNAFAHIDRISVSVYYLVKDLVFVQGWGKCIGGWGLSSSAAHTRVTRGGE